MSVESMYQEIILDHFKHPRHRAPIPEDEVLVEEENPTCGDRIRLTLRVRDGRIEDIRFDGSGCAISTASASMMTEAVLGKPVAAARELIAGFIGMLRGGPGVDASHLEDLVALEGVKRYPLRIKCATMAWHGLGKALDKVGA